MAFAAAAIGDGFGPVVVSPSVNITMTRLLVDEFKSDVACVKASPWFVSPSAVSDAAADFKFDTEVISPVF